MENTPRVSVVVALHNGAQFIERTVRSVLSQTFTQLELVVVDDGSTDEGPQNLRARVQDDRVRLVVKPASGIARTRNVGLNLSHPGSDFVLFVDHDDLLGADLVSLLVERLDGRPDASAAYAFADFIDPDDNALHPGAFASFMRARRVPRRGRLETCGVTEDVTLPEIFLENRIYPPSGVLIRKRVLVDIGGFDASYRVADDWDALVRLARKGPILPVDLVRVGYRRHGSNASGDRALNIRETRAVWANTYFSADNDRELRRTLRQAWRGLHRDRSRRKAVGARREWKAHRFVPALRLTVDAVAHLLLPAPLRRWRLGSRPPQVKTLPEHIAQIETLSSR